MKNMKKEGKHSPSDKWKNICQFKYKSNGMQRTYCSSCRGGFRIDRGFDSPNSRRSE